jgi:Kef-type K+ transport system membrane component KefB
MRTLGALLLLAVALALLHYASAGAPLAASATLALGVLVVTAELAGRLVTRWGWPRVSGYLTAGIILGPSGVGLVGAAEAESLRVIGDAALALFALRAGLALRGRSATPTGLGRYLTTSIGVPFAFTAGAVYALHSWFPLTIHQPPGDALAVALTLGALTAVAAPALTWFTLQDAPDATSGADLLWLNVTRDFAAIPLFAVVLVVARFLTSAGALHPSAFWLPLVALGASVLAGALLAWLVSRFGRFLEVPPGAILLGIAFSAAVAGALGPAEVTLSALVVGLVLARWDDVSAEALRRHFDARGVALAAAAFALVGVGFDMSALGELWPWILLLVGVRAAGLYWGGRWAARDSLVTRVLARRGWLGLISQAGVGLLLAAVGRRAFPEWGVSFEALAVALVAVHATIGPICLRWGLARRPNPMEGVTGAA